MLSRSSCLHEDCLWRRGMNYPDEGDRHGPRAESVAVSAWGLCDESLPVKADMLRSRWHQHCVESRSESPIVSLEANTRLGFILLTTHI